MESFGGPIWPIVGPKMMIRAIHLREDQTCKKSSCSEFYWPFDIIKIFNGLELIHLSEYRQLNILIKSEGQYNTHQDDFYRLIFSRPALY